MLFSRLAVVNERAMWLEQQQVGQIICTPTSKKLLMDMLDEVYVQLQPKRHDWDARQIVIQFITKFVNHKIPGESTSSTLHTPGGKKWVWQSSEGLAWLLVLTWVISGLHTSG